MLETRLDTRRAQRLSFNVAVCSVSIDRFSYLAESLAQVPCN